MIKAIHFSIPSLAGAPIRLVQALNRLSPTQARLIDLQRYGIYDHDVVFSESHSLAQELARDADIIHLHNYMDAKSSHFRHG